MVRSFIVLLFLAISLTGCQEPDSSSAQPVYQKKSSVLSISAEPRSYRSYALVSSGNILVSKQLKTDGPLADIHANGNIQARALGLSVSGKITASNNTSGMAIRSFDYKSNASTTSFVNIRALKVSEYLNTSTLPEYYLLDASGSAIHRIQGQADQPLSNADIAFNFMGDHWDISGGTGTVPLPLVVETSLNITTNNLFIAGSLMVQGDLTASGELNINTGTPFNKALIVDRDIWVEKLVAIGRVHGSGTFISNGEVNIFGNAEIDGDVTLYGDAKINFLDNVYKAALSEAQQETLNDPNTDSTLMLVHSQLFSDMQNNNSVVLFTFVEGDYLLNENKVFQLIESKQVDDFKFRSYLYGASIDYGAQLQKFAGLSPYYKNKLDLINHLKSQGNASVKISESLDIAPSNFYHSFEDELGNLLGTYLVYSFASPFDINNLQTLNVAQRDQVINNILNKDQLQAQRQQNEKQALIDQKSIVLLDTLIDEKTKQEMTAKIDEQLTSIQNRDVVAAKSEAEQARVDEWLSYKDLQSTSEVVTMNDVVVTDPTAARGWWSRIVSVVRTVFINIYYCPPQYETNTIIGVTNSLYWPIYKKDDWSKKISLHNDALNRCVPVSAAMILNYHKHIKKGQAPLYSTGRNTLPRNSAAINNTLVDSLATSFGTSARFGTPAIATPLVSWGMTQRLWQNGIPGYTYSRWTFGVSKAYEHNLVKWYINNNAPPMYTAFTYAGYDTRFQSISWHAMPVIGYTREYYTGWCWKRVLPERKWIMVDTTWRQWSDWDYTNTRASLRFDARSFYWSLGVMHYTWTW